MAIDHQMSDSLAESYTAKIVGSSCLQYHIRCIHCCFMQSLLRNVDPVSIDRVNRRHIPYIDDRLILIS